MEFVSFSRYKKEINEKILVFSDFNPHFIIPSFLPSSLCLRIENSERLNQEKHRNVLEQFEGFWKVVNMQQEAKVNGNYIKMLMRTDKGIALHKWRH